MNACNKLKCVPDKPQQPSLMFVDKVRSLLQSGSPERCLLYSQTSDQTVKAARDKHSSLLLTFVNYSHKKFYNIGPREHQQHFLICDFDNLSVKSSKGLSCFFQVNLKSLAGTDALFSRNGSSLTKKKYQTALSPGACTIKLYGFVIHKQWKIFIVSQCLFYCQSQIHKIQFGRTHQLTTEYVDYESVMFLLFRAQCYQTFYVRNLRKFVISQSVCHWQAFPAQPNVCEKGWSLLKWSN